MKRFLCSRAPLHTVFMTFKQSRLSIYLPLLQRTISHVKAAIDGNTPQENYCDLMRSVRRDMLLLIGIFCISGIQICLDLALSSCKPYVAK